jgi:hypothetical protein
MKKVFLVLAFFLGNKLLAQGVSGSWYGQADVEISGVHSNYLTELIIKQKGDEIEGVFAYYFKDVHLSFYVHGNYNAKAQEISIKNIPIIYFNTNSTANSIDCNTNFLGSLFLSKVKKSINGYFYHDGKYKYTCPDLRVTYVLDQEEKHPDSLLKSAVVGKKFWKPQPDDYIVSTTETKKEEIDASATKVKNAPLTLKSADNTPDKNDDTKKIEASFAKRKSILSKELIVESDSVELSFYDNGDIDGDSISVFLNNKVVLTHKGLDSKAINIYMKLDSTKEVNEVSMFAENLGSIPPNTALMVVTDGVNRYEVYMSSSLTQNSAVRLRRKK